jgi:hypothetical protein
MHADAGGGGVKSKDLLPRIKIQPDEKRRRMEKARPLPTHVVKMDE